ncbi:MAG: hypothetical protein ABR992_04450 [Solirubrobacteraceae bacterium]|jgi:hypothetical protein
MATWQLDPRYEQPSACLRELVDLVLGDLQGSDPIPLQVGWEPAYAWPGPVAQGEEEIPPYPMLMISEPSRWGGVGWTPAAPGAGGDREWGDRFTPAELAVGLADCLQEQFFPETAAAWGQARPACPGHTHPAEPRLIDGDAWWTCPRDGHALARFGMLAPC